MLDKISRTILLLEALKHFVLCEKKITEKFSYVEFLAKDQLQINFRYFIRDQFVISNWKIREGDRFPNIY